MRTPTAWSSLSALDGSIGLTHAHQRDTAARDDAFFDRGAGGVQRVLDASLLLLHLDSVAAPTLITATPPASLARRSCSFSRS
jgi:hypothetical protein